VFSSYLRMWFQSSPASFRASATSSTKVKLDLATRTWKFFETEEERHNQNSSHYLRACSQLARVSPVQVFPLRTKNQTPASNMHAREGGGGAPSSTELRSKFADASSSCTLRCCCSCRFSSVILLSKEVVSQTVFGRAYLQTQPPRPGRASTHTH
jgi:hypothetical protein